MLLLTSCTRPKGLALVRWTDESNDAYAIEIAHGDGHAVVIPRVRAIQTTERFILGRADWKYHDGYPTNSSGVLITNEFWFALDKARAYPKLYALISTNEQRWIDWCVHRNVGTNLLQVGEFLQFARTNHWHDEESWL